MNEVNKNQPVESAHGRNFGAPIMEMKNITMRFGGVVAIQDISFDILEGEIRANNRSKRRWQIFDVECD